MKKLWFFLAMFVCVLASCSDGGSDDPSNPTPKPEEVKTEITIDSGIVTNGLSFDAEAGEKSLSFSVNANWTLSIASTTSGATWCKASATSGSKGSANVKFTVDENTSYDDRSVSITIKAGTVSKTFTITQKGADAMLVTTTKYEVAQEGGKIEVEVKANVDYQFAISETAKDWITETKSKSRGLTTYKHSFDIAENEEAEKREGEITFKSGDKVETVKVYQAGGAIILLTQNEYTVSDAGETISVDIKSNVEYGVQMPDVDWITDEASGRGMSSHTLKYVVAPNEGYDARSAEIIFYDKNSDLKDTLKVVQAQKDAIVISKKEYDVKAEGETVEVKLSANVEFEVTMPEVDWISQTESRSLKEHTLYFKVAENASEERRSAEITITNQDRRISETVVVIQQGNGMFIVKLDNAGTLKSRLGNSFSDIKSLKIIGPINGDDVYTLREMLKGIFTSEAKWGELTMLDLSEASIVEGGEWYYADEEECFTSNNIIGDHMFHGCKNLQTIVLPDNISSIGYCAFSACSSLISVNIPKGVSSIGEHAFSQCPINSITIPNGVKSIGRSAFSECKSLTSVIIPDNITSLGWYAFKSCRSLTSIVIGDGITSVPRAAFSDCKLLTSITFGKNITSINKSAFSNCISLSSIVIPNGIDTIEDSAFSCVFADNSSTSALKTVTIGKNVKSIGDEVFRSAPITICYSYATTPPSTMSRTFTHVDKDAVLYVPAESVEAYKDTHWGRIFANIIKMD